MPVPSLADGSPLFVSCAICHVDRVDTRGQRPPLPQARDGARCSIRMTPFPETFILIRNPWPLSRLGYTRVDACCLVLSATRERFKRLVVITPRRELIETWLVVPHCILFVRYMIPDEYDRMLVTMKQLLTITTVEMRLEQNPSMSSSLCTARHEARPSTPTREMDTGPAL